MIIVLKTAVLTKIKEYRKKPSSKYKKDKPNEATQIDTEVIMARLDETVVLYLIGDVTETYLSAVSAARVKTDAVPRMKYNICEVDMISTIFTIPRASVMTYAVNVGFTNNPTSKSVADKLSKK